MKAPPIVAVVAVACVLGGLLGCATTKQQQPPPLTIDDIISMARAGKADTEIIQSIKTRRTFYRLGAEDVIKLHEGGVSNAVIDHMLQTGVEAAREEERRYSRSAYPYYWHPYYGYWYYHSPSVVIIKRR